MNGLQMKRVPGEPRYVSKLRHATLMAQIPSIRLQWDLIAALGLHGPLRVMEVAGHMYVDRPRSELPLATVELELLELRATGLVRRILFSRIRRYGLTRYGRQVYRDRIDASDIGQSKITWSDGLLP